MDRRRAGANPIPAPLLTSGTAVFGPCRKDSGGIALPGIKFQPDVMSRGVAAGGAYCHRSHRGFRRTGNKGHRAGASIIGFVELTKAGTMLTNVMYRRLRFLRWGRAGYFIMCYPLSRYSRYLENKFNAAHHH